MTALGCICTETGCLFRCPVCYPNGEPGVWCPMGTFKPGQPVIRVCKACRTELVWAESKAAGYCNACAPPLCVYGDRHQSVYGGCVGCGKPMPSALEVNKNGDSHDQ